MAKRNRFASLPMWSPSRKVDLSAHVGQLLDEARVVHPEEARAQIAALAYALGAELSVEENIPGLPDGIDYQAIVSSLFAIAKPSDELRLIHSM